MTKNEVEAFMAQLQAGKRFVTRFQEEEWGLAYVGDGRYQKWSRRDDQESQEILPEAALVDLLLTHYRYDVMVACLRD